MNCYQTKAIRRSNTMLLTAAVAVAVSVLSGQSMFTCSAYLICIPLLLVAGFCVAMGLKEFAAVFLTEAVDPWYVRRGGMVFLVIMLIIINMIYMSIVSQFSPVLGLDALAVELFWIALLDRPRSNPTKSSFQMEDRSED